MTVTTSGARKPGRRTSSIAASVAVATVCLVMGTPAAGVDSSPEERNRSLQTSSLSTQRLPFGRWVPFDVGETGSLSSVFRFSAPTPVRLRVTDALCRGDEFLVKDRGYPLFRTSRVGTDPTCDSVPHLSGGRRAWLDKSYSKGKFLLQPGSHAVRIRITDSPFGGATAFLRADRQPVR